MPNASDISHMHHALRLGARGLGRTWPNPSVGAVVVKDGLVVGTGTTARGGRPHAETQALAQAGEAARGATLYVTLEPCAHHGKTPPCTEAIIASGIKRVVAACSDHDVRVSGKGFTQLRAAGIAVEEGVCEAEGKALCEGFFSTRLRGRPFVTLKLATSLDGKIATANGDSKWITGEASRRKVHWLRATQDAIMTGIGTVLADNPQLTCRLAGREKDSPQRVVMDSQLRIPADAAILPAWIFTSHDAMETKKAQTLKQKGASLFAVDAGLSLPQALKKLAELGITRLMVEAGGRLAGEYMRSGLVDRIYWFRAPVIIGDKGMAGLAMDSQEALAALPRHRLQKVERFGPDILEIYDSIAI